MENRKQILKQKIEEGEITTFNQMFDYISPLELALQLDGELSRTNTPSDDMDFYKHWAKAVSVLSRQESLALAWLAFYYYQHED